MIARLHNFADRLGIKPAVLDAFLAAVALAAFNWIAYGGPFDVDSVRLALGLAILGVVGVAAPAAQGVDQSAVIKAKPSLRRTR